MLIPQKITIVINPSRIPGAADITVTPRYEASHTELIEYLSMAAQGIFSQMGDRDGNKEYHKER